MTKSLQNSIKYKLSMINVKQPIKLEFNNQIYNP